MKNDPPPFSDSSYETALQKLQLITLEAGWFHYDENEEEWQLWNDEDELLFTAPTIEDLVECSCPTLWQKGEERNKEASRYGKMAGDRPLIVDPNNSYMYRKYDDR